MNVPKEIAGAVRRRDTDVHGADAGGESPVIWVAELTV